MRTTAKLSMLCPPVIIGLTTGVVCVVSTEILAVLVAWIVISAPIAVLVGHCVLSEE
jgi:hypothetical protein